MDSDSRHFTEIPYQPSSPSQTILTPGSSQDSAGGEHQSNQPRRSYLVPGAPLPDLKMSHVHNPHEQLMGTVRSLIEDLVKFEKKLIQEKSKASNAAALANTRSKMAQLRLDSETARKTKEAAMAELKSQNETRQTSKRPAERQLGHNAPFSWRGNNNVDRLSFDLEAHKRMCARYHSRLETCEMKLQQFHRALATLKDYNQKQKASDKACPECNVVNCASFNCLARRFSRLHDTTTSHCLSFDQLGNPLKSNGGS